MVSSSLRSTTRVDGSAAPAPVRAAVYLRISQDHEMTGLAIERQRADCLAIVAERGWTLVQPALPYEDTQSATDARKERPGYARLVADYDAGKFDAVVCWDLDRLTRRPRELEDWIDRAENRGLRLVTANGEADLTTDGGRLYARVKAAVARGEMERKSARQSAAQLQRARLGKAPKGVRPVGYSVHGELVPHEAQAVAAVYEAFRNGSSLRSIARALSGEAGDDVAPGVPALPKHTRTLAIERNAARAAATPPLPAREVPDDGPWSPSTVLGLLRNPRYAGYSVYTDVRDRRAGDKRATWRNQIVTDDAGKPVRGTWEPIVDEAVWEAVQVRLDDPARKTNRKGTHRRHLGSGLYRCGLCGHPVRGNSRGYTCKEGHLNRTGAPIDDLVRRVVVARLSDPALHERVAPDHADELATIKRTIEAAYAAIDKAQRDYDADLIEAADLRRKRERQRAAIDEADARRKALVSDHGTVSILGTDDPAQAFLDAELGVQRQVIDLLCEVVLHPQPQGRKGFDPDSVDVTLRGPGSADGTAG